MGGKTGKQRSDGPAKIAATKVEGGWVTRDARSGRFVEVTSDKGTYRARPESEAAIEKASKDRHDALKRLANR